MNKRTVIIILAIVVGIPLVGMAGCLGLVVLGAADNSREKDAMNGTPEAFMKTFRDLYWKKDYALIEYSSCGLHEWVETAMTADTKPCYRCGRDQSSASPFVWLFG